jgi:hypothetical protein
MRSHSGLVSNLPEDTTRVQQGLLSNGRSLKHCAPSHKHGSSCQLVEFGNLICVRSQPCAGVPVSVQRGELNAQRGR